MSETVTLPELGESVTEGTVTRWLKQVGESVEVDEPLVEVSTDKVDTEIPSPVAGVLEEILVPEDETVEVGADLAKVGAGDGAAASSEPEAPAAPEAEEAPAADSPAESAPAESAPAAESSESVAPAASGDSTEVTLPELGESVTEGTVTRWLKEVGDSVEVDEPLLEVSTDKVDTEIPSPVAGTLLEVKVSEDDTVEVGAVLALVGSGSPAGDSAPSAPAPAAESEAPAEPAPEPASAPSAPAAPEAPAAPAPAAPAPAAAPKAPAAPAASAPATSTAPGYVTPLVRKLANDNGVDLSTVSGTGVGGRIRKQDVQAAIDAAAAATPAAPEAPAAPAAKAPAAPSAEAAKLRGTTIKAPRIRQVIAKRMRESLDVSTQLTQVQEVDMTRIVKLRKSAKAKFSADNGVNLTYLPFISEAVTEALKVFPEFNASYDQDKQEITYHAAEHLGIAVDTDKGLVVPVIADAGDLNLAGLSKKISDLAARARVNKLGPDELSGSTFTITNIGSAGALFDTPIINQPNVGILGTGIIQKRPVVVTDADGDDVIAIRQMMYLSLTYDHRLVDGATAGRFLQAVKARLEAGEFAGELGL